MQGPFSCGMWDLVCQPGIEPEHLVSVGVWNLSQWTSREVPLAGFLDVTWPLLLDIFPGLSSPRTFSSQQLPHCVLITPWTPPPANPQSRRKFSLDLPEEPVKYRKGVLGSKPDEFTAQPCPLPSCDFRQLISSFWPSGSSPGTLIQSLAQCFSNLS